MKYREAAQIIKDAQYYAAPGIIEAIKMAIRVLEEKAEEEDE